MQYNLMQYNLMQYNILSLLNLLFNISQIHPAPFQIYPNPSNRPCPSNIHCPPLNTSSTVHCPPQSQLYHVPSRYILTPQMYTASFKYTLPPSNIHCPLKYTMPPEIYPVLSTLKFIACLFCVACFPLSLLCCLLPAVSSWISFCVSCAFCVFYEKHHSQVIVFFFWMQTYALWNGI